MKEKIMKNIGLKILSIILAVIMWVVIVNLADPIRTKTIRDIPVEVLHDDAITSINQVYEIVSGDTVDVVVRGKRSVVDSLKRKDFIATADLSKLSRVNAAAIKVILKRELSYPPELDWGDAMLKITLEEVKTPKYRVEVKPIGEVEDGYFLGDFEVKPNMVEVSGGESKIDKIASVAAVINVDGATSDIKQRVSLKAFDEKGKEIDTTNLKFLTDSVMVSVHVYGTKTVPLVLDTKGTPAEGYGCVQTEFKPETVEIAGSERSLSKVDELKMELSLDDAKEDIEEEIDLSKLLPDGIYLVNEENSMVSVRATIEQLVNRSLALNPEDINILNMEQGLHYTFKKPEEQFSVEFQGLQDNISEITIERLKPFIDLKDYKEGTHKVRLQFELPDGLRMISDTVKISVTLAKSETVTPSTSHEPTPSASPVPTATPGLPDNSPDSDGESEDDTVITNP